MKVERNEREIIVDLSAEEVSALQARKTVGDRPGITCPDAKIEVLPLGAIEPDGSLEDRYTPNRFEKGLATPLKGELFPNGDLRIIVPAIKLSDVRIGGARLPREAIKTPMTGDNEEYVSLFIPEQGIRLRFGGSLQIIDVFSDYYSF